MATITGNTIEKVFPIDKFLGLHENPDGDTKLKNGEASVIRNWKITRDRNLTRRPGSKTIVDIGTNAPVVGLWYGYVNGREEILAASSGRMWRLYDAETSEWVCEDIGAINCENSVTFFPFEDKVYVLNGHEYKSYDGTYFGDVVGYRPLISISNVPSGGGELLEQVNKLNGTRRLWFSPDGEASEFVLPEQDILSLDYVMDTATGDYIFNGQYETDLLNGKIRFYSSETFEGDGTTKKFDLKNSSVGKVHVFVDGEEIKGDYEYDKDNRFITFTEAPEEDSVISVTETIAKEQKEYFIGDGVTQSFTLKNAGIASYYLETDEGVRLEKTTDYTETNNVITFTSVPSFLRTITVFEETVNERVETFDSDGLTTVFFLKNSDITKISVKVDNVTQTEEPEYTFDGVSVAFDTAPADEAVILIDEDIVPTRGTNTIEIGYTAAATYRPDVTKMRFAELFAGQNDTRVFLYGDGSNEAIYSDIDYDGKPRADYFPDLNEVAVGDENTPITGMIRHFAHLVTYKSDSTWDISYSTATLADGNMTAALYVSPVNKAIGNRAAGQQQLVLNNPRTLFGNDIYEWVNSSYYTSNLSRDERQAKRISDRIYATLNKFDLKNCYCYDDNDNQEYYVIDGLTALVQNYAADAWYVYTGLDIVCMANFNKELYFGTHDGKIKRLSQKYMNDDGQPFESYWESGSVDFSSNIQRKYTSDMWIVVKPSSRSHTDVTVLTDKKSEYAEKSIDLATIDFNNIDFEHFTFLTNRMPKSHKLKIKAKKFTYYKLILKTNDKLCGSTVLSATMKVRYTGYVK